MKKIIDISELDLIDIERLTVELEDILTKAGSVEGGIVLNGTYLVIEVISSK